jgi:hypothetical protein
LVAPTYVAAFDDSGGNESLVKWDGSLIAGDHPLACVAVCYLRSDLVDDFECDWMALRARIQDELGLEAPPPIHMRLMWGKDCWSRKYRGEANPYRHATFEQIQEWVGEALAIMSRFSRIDRGFGRRAIHQHRHVAAERQTRYLVGSLGTEEMGIIKAKSRRLYRHYHRAITSPLLPLLSEALLSVNAAMHAVRAQSVSCLVDRFPHSKGIDEAEVVEAARDICGLTYVSELRRVDADAHALTQAADVYGFTEFRRLMAHHKHIPWDEPMRSIVLDNPVAPFCTADIDHIIRRQLAWFEPRAVAIHYVLARRRIEELDPDLAAQMIDVGTFLERAISNRGTGEPGISVFVEMSEMPKTPDRAGAS